MFSNKNELKNEDENIKAMQIQLKVSKKDLYEVLKYRIPPLPSENPSAYQSREQIENTIVQIKEIIKVIQLLQQIDTETLTYPSDMQDLANSNLNEKALKIILERNKVDNKKKEELLDNFRFFKSKKDNTPIQSTEIEDKVKKAPKHKSCNII